MYLGLLLSLLLVLRIVGTLISSTLLQQQLTNMRGSCHGDHGTCYVPLRSLGSGTTAVSHVPVAVEHGIARRRQ